MKHSEAFEKLVETVMPDVKEVAADKVKANLESGREFYLVDVREDSEWNQGRIKGSIHIGRGVIERDIENIIKDKSEEVVLYCGGGYRSALAAFNIQQMGYSNVYSMAGGIRKWRELDYEEER